MERNAKGQTEAEFLAAYNPGSYERPSVTVDMLLFTVEEEAVKSYRKLPEKVLKVLLIKRKDHPYLNCWAIPGGFVEMDESLDQAASRELKEETSIDGVYMEQLYTFGDPGRDPRMRVISCAYMALVDSSKLTVKAMDDAEDAAWFEVGYKFIREERIVLEAGCQIRADYQLLLENEGLQLEAMVRQTTTIRGNATLNHTEILSQQGLSFDHGKVIVYGIERLRNKIEYTDIAFNLMPERFTLTELQQVYEIILGKEMLKANFRRKIAPYVLETNDYTKDKGHRPSKLFRYNTMKG